MSYVFSDMQSKLSSLLGDSNTSTSDQWPSATRLKELNRGEMAFCRESKLVREKATGTISGTTLAMPADLLDVVVLIVGNYVITRDREVGVEDYERWYNYGGNILMYYISQVSGTVYFNFFGASDGLAYILHYIKKPSAEMAADGDVSILPEEYREGPVYYAASELLRQIGKNQIADGYYQRYQSLVRDAQAMAEENFMSKKYARPDTNLLLGASDVVGGGYDYGVGI